LNVDQTERSDFLPNIQDDSLTIAQLLLYFVPVAGAAFPAQAKLSLTGLDVVGNPVSIAGVASTLNRRRSVPKDSSS
jgi:hypothetical protein